MDSNKERRSTRFWVFLALMAALEFVFERFLTIPPASMTATLRFGFTFVPRSVCGACFGAIPAAICDIVADLLGCLYGGYAPNPGITVAAALRGAVFGLFLHKKITVPRIIIASAIDQFFCGLVIVTLSLFWFSGMPLKAATVIPRIVQAVVIFAGEVAFLIVFRKTLFVRLKKYINGGQEM